MLARGASQRRGTIRVVGRDRDNRIISPPVTDVLNVLPLASSQISCEFVFPLQESGSLQGGGEESVFSPYCPRDTPNICRGFERGKGTELGPLGCRQR